MLGTLVNERKGAHLDFKDKIFFITHLQLAQEPGNYPWLKNPEGVLTQVIPQKCIQHWHNLS